ncbi:MAG: ATP-binding cassette domain-containing protein [Phycisphaerales bacterium]|nr:ATP-binding cassette domain-containing protein [Phycisphaerales bacterium]
MHDIVSVIDLRHQYGEFVALDGVSFEVLSGDCFGLLGPNGSGKTTLFRILTTLLTPSGGRARICGHDIVTERSEARRQIGVVFQAPSLDIQLTSRENLRHHGHLYGMAGDELNGRIDEALQALNVADRAEQLVKTLSGGLRRRVELAKCLLHDPALLILDEPSTGLDPRARMELWRHLSRVQAEKNMTILLTTHFMDEAERCSRLAILDRGRLVVCGTPSELKQRIGGDCITIECDEPADLSRRINSQISVEPSVVNGAVRIETERGTALATEVMNRFGDELKAVTIGKPTLEDVFVHETGHSFDTDAPDEVPER